MWTAMLVNAILSGNDAQYSWKNLNDGDPNFPEFPFDCVEFDASFLGSSYIKIQRELRM